MQRIALMGLFLVLAACSSKPDYPAGVTTNAVMGEKERGLIYTQPVSEGHNAICVGEWCSCDSE
ncbi:MAG: hypothetical protein WC612_08200 [Bdellovibrionales bacterium]|jgi:hypothetical protein